MRITLLDLPWTFTTEIRCLTEAFESQGTTGIHRPVRRVPTPAVALSRRRSRRRPGRRPGGIRAFKEQPQSRSQERAEAAYRLSTRGSMAD